MAYRAIGYVESVGTIQLWRIRTIQGEDTRDAKQYVLRRIELRRDGKYVWSVGTLRDARRIAKRMLDAATTIS